MPPATRVRAVLFDLDDTLYPERDYVRSGFRAVSDWAAATLAADPRTTFDALWRMFVAGVRGDTFDRWLQQEGFAPDDHRQAMVRAYREHAPSIAPFPRAPDLLQRLRRRYRLGLLTDGDAGVQRRKLQALGIGRHFDAVILTDELGREFWKPHPRPFERLLQRLEVEPAAAVYVADNCAKDFLGARRVGLRTIRLRRADAEYCDVEPPTARHAPEVTAGSLEEVERAIERFDRVD
ncbi:MAG TPA: HAD family hydrolase [Myxococcales bacterium]|jgi:putative hydrolase of the HAD superfamily